MTTIYTYRDKLRLYEQMKNQSDDDSHYVLHLLKKNKEEYSVNMNGVFFDLNYCNDDTLRELMVYYKHLKPLYY
jgi:hypothetical protein